MPNNRLEQPNLELGICGNCTIAMLIDRAARIVWGAFPRLDSDPAFHALVNGDVAYRPQDADSGGYFSIELEGQTDSQQEYITNTAILRTRLTAGDGSKVDVIDFAPRHVRYERTFRPPMIMRRLIPVEGQPRVIIRLRPRFDWGRTAPKITIGSNHLRYVSDPQTLRLTATVPLSYVVEETPFILDRPQALILGSDEPISGGIEETVRDQFERTSDYWQEWVLSLSIPFEWQEAVIRAAITLKLCNFEETGAIVAALTTSIPEAANSGRNWDYRLCWPRDAFFVIRALNGLGATRTMEDYLAFMINAIGNVESGPTSPLFSITRHADLTERTIPWLAGYRGMGPVRTGNQAHEQVQNDVFGSVVLAGTHLFYDRRLVRIGQLELFEKLEKLGHRAAQAFDQPDAGPWELRHSASVHTFSSLVCWAACDRLAKIASTLERPDKVRFWQQQAQHIHETICAQAWNPALNSFVSTFQGHDLDASLLLLTEFGFLPASDPRYVGTVAAIERELKHGNMLLRYAIPDDFGRPETAFVVCTFWYIDALARLGRMEEARALFETILAKRNNLGLLSEDIDQTTGELWGNFPQTYSMVGLINAAKRLSKKWEDAV